MFVGGTCQVGGRDCGRGGGGQMMQTLLKSYVYPKLYFYELAINNSRGSLGMGCNSFPFTLNTPLPCGLSIPQPYPEHNIAPLSSDMPTAGLYQWVVISSKGGLPFHINRHIWRVSCCWAYVCLNLSQFQYVLWCPVFIIVESLVR